MWEKQAEKTHSYKRFMSTFKGVSDNQVAGRHGGECLFDLQKERHSVADLAFKFHIIVASTGPLDHSVRISAGD